MTLVSLVYVSFASESLTDQALDEMLVKIRAKNQELNVTGMLLYRDGFFIQALEGEAEVVQKLYDKIKSDPRHRNVILVMKNPILKRSFTDWSMGFNKLNHENTANIPGFTDFLAKPPEAKYFTDQPSRAQVLLDSFRNQQYF